MLDVPRVFQREHAGKPDRRQHVEQKNCAHAEKQNHQQQREPEDRGRIHKWQPQRYHDEQQKRQRGRQRWKLHREISRIGDVAEEFWRARLGRH